jgi:hypothetical protein
MINWKGYKRNADGLIEVLFKHFPGWTENTINKLRTAVLTAEV